MRRGGGEMAVPSTLLCCWAEAYRVQRSFNSAPQRPASGSSRQQWIRGSGLLLLAAIPPP